MKHVKRVHANGSKSAVNNQGVKPSAKAAPAAAGPDKPLPTNPPEQSRFLSSLALSRAAFDLFKLVDDEERSIARENGDVTRFRIINSAMGIVCEQTSRMIGDEGPGSADAQRHGLEKVNECGRFKPFGSLEPTYEVEMARHHIKDAWKDSLTKNACDVCGGHFPALVCCLGHNPGVTAENAALRAIAEAHNELVELMNAEKPGRLNGRKLTGAQLWLAKKLNQADSKPFAEFLSLIEDALPIIQDDAKSKQITATIRKMLWGRDVLRRMDVFQDNIPLN